MAIEEASTVLGGPRKSIEVRYVPMLWLLLNPNPKPLRFHVAHVESQDK